MTKDDDIKYEADLSAEAPAGAKAEEKIKKTKNKLKICEQERAEYLAGWQRAKADLINYKREQEQKISEIFRFANEGLIFEILPILDSFEAALKHKNDEGIKQLYNQLLSILKNNGLEEIKTIGEKFNPELHESVGEGEGKEQGIVVEEVQKGYKLNGKLIRASKVKINK